jgi:hypothetical protein
MSHAEFRIGTRSQNREGDDLEIKISTELSKQNQSNPLNFASIRKQSAKITKK